MKLLFGISWVVILPLLLWSRWNGEAGLFILLLSGWVASALGYLVLNERDK